MRLRIRLGQGFGTEAQAGVWCRGSVRGLGLGFGLGTHGGGVDPVAHEEHGVVDAGVVAPGATDHATLVTAKGGVDLVGVRVRVRGRVRGRGRGRGRGTPTSPVARVTGYTSSLARRA